MLNKIMNATYVKWGKGHDVYMNGTWKMWVIGSKKSAEEEVEKLEFNLI